MGSFSVYCGISNITISSGQECVLLPIKKIEFQESSDFYQEYLPLTLPIFGNYDDYGGIEDIIEDDNTRLIEQHFNCTIEEFCEYITGDREDSPLCNNEELKGCSYMRIDKKVYDFLSTDVSIEYGGAGNLKYNNQILNLIGFNQIDNNTWEIQGKTFKTSYGGRISCENEIDSDIIEFNGKENYSLSSYIDIPEEKKWIGTKAMWQLWEHLEDEDAKKILLSILLGRYESNRFTNLLRLGSMNIYRESMNLPLLSLEDILPNNTLNDKYTNNFRTYGKLLCDLRTILYNFRSMSGSFKPFVSYITRQFGNYKRHQIILDKFSEINKSLTPEDEDE